MTTRAALLHPLGVTLFVGSLLAIAALKLLPGLERWAAQAPWVLVLGFIAYVASVIAVRILPPEVRRDLSAPELRKLDSIRRAMETKLKQREAADGGSSELTGVVLEAIVHLDVQVTPALQQLLARQKNLSELLAKYDRGELPLPEPAVLERLRRISSRQRTAIEECVQQASNAAGTLEALLQESDDEVIASEARAWADDLLTLYDSVGDVLRGEEGQGVLEDNMSR